MSDSRDLVPTSGVLRADVEPWSGTPSLRDSVRGPGRYAWILTVLFIIGGGLWAGTIKLAGGAVAPGVISPEGGRKTVQHLEGGIIARLHVGDGDLVAKGQPLVEIESLQPRATHDMLVSQQRAFSLTRQRLEAEKAGAGDLRLPPHLAADDPVTIRLFVAQRELMIARRDAHLSRKQVLAQRSEQLQEQIRGFEAQVESAMRQLALIADELEGKRQLYDKGLARKPEVRQLERAEAEIGGRRGEYLASIARAREQIGEARLQSLTLDAERLDDISTQLDKVQIELLTTEERLRASADVLARTTITAPVSGKVVNLKFKAERGVVQPGVPIMDIVPAEDTLLIDARVSPTDIDVIHAGLKAQVQLSAYASRSVPRIAGIVRSVSADRLLDDQTRLPYFLARIEVDRAHLAEIGKGVELLAGMPAEVLIVTGERTMAEYLLQPFLDALWRSFREV